MFVENMHVFLTTLHIIIVTGATKKPIGSRITAFRSSGSSIRERDNRKFCALTVKIQLDE